MAASRKRTSLKKTLLTKIIIFVAVIIVIITQISIKLAADNIQSLTNGILARESATYAGEIYSWWSSIEERVWLPPFWGKTCRWHVLNGV